MTVERYNETIKRLKKAGVHHPAGRTYHAAFGTTDKLSVFDVWASQAAFDKFGQTLLPILQELGVESGPPSVMAVHSVIIPPAKAAPATTRPSAKRAAPRRRAAKPARKKR
jgi:hypothetical protein